MKTIQEQILADRHRIRMESDQKRLRDSALIRFGADQTTDELETLIVVQWGVIAFLFITVILLTFK